MADDIKKILLNEIDSLISNKSDVARANAVAKLGAQVIYKERVEHEAKDLKERVRMWDRIGGAGNE